MEFLFELADLNNKKKNAAAKALQGAPLHYRRRWAGEMTQDYIICAFLPTVNQTTVPEWLLERK